MKENVRSAIKCKKCKKMSEVYENARSARKCKKCKKMQEVQENVRSARKVYLSQISKKCFSPSLCQMKFCIPQILVNNPLRSFSKKCIFQAKLHILHTILCSWIGSCLRYYSNARFSMYLKSL